MSKEGLEQKLEEKEPGRFVFRRWKIFLWIGLGVLGLTFVPVVRRAPLRLIFYTAELFVYVGIPVAFLLWAMLLARYFAKAQGKRFVGYALKSGVMVIVSVGVLTMLSPFAVGGGHVTQTAGMWFRMKAFADVGAIREWGEKVEMKKNDRGVEVYVGELPECVKKLRPGHVTVDSKTRAVNVDWGGGFGHWGLWVGPKGGDYRPGGFALKLEDGAYVWDRE